MSKGDIVTGYAHIVQRVVTGPVYYIFSNGVGVLTRDGIVLMNTDEIEKVRNEACNE